MVVPVSEHVSILHILDMKKWLIWAMYIGIGLLVFLVGTGFMLATSWERAYRRQVSRLQKQGIPVEPKKLQKQYRTRNPDRKNYSSFEFPSKLTSIQERYNDLQWAGNDSLTPRKAALEVKPDMKKHEEKIQELLAEDVRPARLDLTRFVKVEMKHAGERMDEARFLEAYALAHYFGGTPEKAVRALQKKLRITRALLAEPVFVQSLFAYSIIGIIRATLEEMMTAPERLPSSIKQLRPHLNPQMVRDALLPAQDAEVSMAITTLKKYGRKAGGLSSSSGSSSYRYPEPLVRKWAANFIRRYLDWRKIIQKPYYKNKRSREKFKDDINRIDDSWSLYTDKISVQLFPTYDETYKQHVIAMASVEVMRAGIGYCLDRRRGKIPKTATPDLSETTDPFTGDPLRVRKTDSYIYIYSTGPDQEDDGGRNKSTDDDLDDVRLRIAVPDDEK